MKYDLNPKRVYACKGIHYKSINTIIVKLDNKNISIKNTFDEEKTIKKTAQKVVVSVQILQVLENQKRLYACLKFDKGFFSISIKSIIRHMIKAADKKPTAFLFLEVPSAKCIEFTKYLSFNIVYRNFCIAYRE